MLHPDLAERDCEHCKKYLYDAHGNPVPTRAAQITGEDGDYRLREASSPPECRTPKGCPKGTPEKPNTLNFNNAMAFEHYQECKATSQWPDDSVVRRNAVLIREIEDYAKRIGHRMEYERTRQLLMSVKSDRKFLG